MKKKTKGAEHAAGELLVGTIDGLFHNIVSDTSVNFT